MAQLEPWRLILMQRTKAATTRRLFCATSMHLVRPIAEMMLTVCVDETLGNYVFLFLSAAAHFPPTNSRPIPRNNTGVVPCFQASPSFPPFPSSDPSLWRLPKSVECSPTFPFLFSFFSPNSNHVPPWLTVSGGLPRRFPPRSWKICARPHHLVDPSLVSSLHSFQDL